MPTSIRHKGLWVLAWFVALFVFNIASHWSQNVDKTSLYILADGLSRFTAPLELLISAAVVYAILAYGKTKTREGEARPLKKRLFSSGALQTAYVLGGVVLGIIAIGLLLAWLQSKQQSAKSAVNLHTLDDYELMSKSKAELGTEQDGLSPETKKRMREMLALEMAGGFQKQNNPIQVYVAGEDHNVLVFQMPSMDEENAKELVEGFKERDASFWNAMRLMNFSQVVFAGDRYKRVVSREEFLGYGKDYEKYRDTFLQGLMMKELNDAVAEAKKRGQPLPGESGFRFPTLAQLKKDNATMSTHDFKQLRAATGLGHLMELLKNDSFRPASALYLSDGTVCYRYTLMKNGEQTKEAAALATDGRVYVNVISKPSWKRLCESKEGEEILRPPR